ncbi:MAG: dihydroorotase [Actinobacteria bacterium]|nr:dihydroorotase [Actinomycetota bacterium]
MIGITGGLVYTVTGMHETSVWIDGSTVVSLGDEPPGVPHTVIDAGGMLVGPGFVDLHTHLREPGETWKEDVESGSRAAAAGGYTALVAMPNTRPPLDRPELIEEVRLAGSRAGQVHVSPSATLTLGRDGVEPVDLVALHRAGVRIFTDDGAALGDTAVMRQAMQVAAGLAGAVVAQHAEDLALTGGGLVHAGDASRRLGLPGVPVEAETRMVTRDLGLAGETGARYHCQHVSAEATLGLIRAAKEQGLAVTCEVTPHHLALDTDDLITAEPNLKMYPPLRSPQDRVALVEALGDGTIDCVATDHAPHLAVEKEVGFAEAPRGVIGLETAAPVVWGVLGDPVRMFLVMSVRPAEIAGLTRHGQPVGPGAPANLVVFDPCVEWRAGGYLSKSTNSPFTGRRMPGRAVVTIHEGVVTHQLEGVG